MTTQTLTFDRNNNRFEVTISLTNDDINEAVESFIARLSTLDNDTMLSPAMAMIEVTDDDGEEQNNTLTYSATAPGSVLMLQLHLFPPCLQL